MFGQGALTLACLPQMDENGPGCQDGGLRTLFYNYFMCRGMIPSIKDFGAI